MKKKEEFVIIVNLIFWKVKNLGTYLFPIKTAMITFLIAGYILLIPFLVWQYRKHGYINYLRTFVLYSLLLFAMTAYYLIILPFPTTFDTCSLQRPGTQHYQITPFASIMDIFRETKVNFANPMSYIGILKERAFLQVAFNFLLLLPLGIYLRYYFRRNLLQTVIITFFVSLFFEVTQLTGFYGLYNCPYRLFDVDDLFLNTLGGFVGYMIAPVFAYFLPDVKEMDEKVDPVNEPVRMTRRFLALWIDWIVISIVSPLVFNLQVSITSIFNPVETLDDLFLVFILIFGYFIVLPYFTNGKTFGKWVLHFRVKGQGERVTFIELCKRYGLLYYGIGGINYILFAARTLNQQLDIAFLLLFCIFNGLILLHFVLHIFKRDKRLFYEKMSKTYNVITFKKNK